MQKTCAFRHDSVWNNDRKKNAERCYKSDYCKNKQKCFAKHIATVNT